MGLFSKKGNSEPRKIFGSDSKENKVNKFAIQNSLDNCRDSIQTMIDNYDQNIDTYTNKVVTMLKQKRRSEANRYKEKIKQIMFRRERMSQLYDQVDSFQMMIDEAFAKNEVYNTLGKAVSQVNKIAMNPKMEAILKDMKQFEKSFAEGCNSFDQIFEKIGSSMNKIDLDASNEYDAEIKSIVDSKMEQMEETTFNVDEDEKEIDDLMSSL